MAEERVKVTLEVDLPQELYREFLQYFRDFDTKHGNGTRCHFEFGVNAPSMKNEEMLATFRSIDPPFKYETVIPKDKLGET